MNYKIVARYIFLLTLLCFGVFVFFYGHYMVHFQRQQMDSHAKVIEENIWNYNFEGMAEYLDLALARDNYARITIKGISSEELFVVEGSDLMGLDRILDRIGLFPQKNMYTDVKHDGLIIAQLIVQSRNVNVYVYFYTFLVLSLICITAVLFIKTINAKHQVEYQVEERTVELRESEAQLRTLIGATPDLVWLKDPNGVYISCNKKTELLFGAREADILGKTDYHFIDKESADLFRERDEVTLTTGKTSIFEEEITYEYNGQKELLETIRTPVYDFKGKLMGVLGVARDIADRKKVEEELIKAKEKAEYINKAKSEFLMNVSHDIRTPMNVINGYTDLLMKSPLNNKQEKFCAMIKRKGVELINLIEDIIDISAVEKGKVRMHKSPFSVRKLTEDIRETVIMHIGEKEIDFECHVTEEVPKKLLGDSMRLKQILENLCGNAVKYTGKGKISLTISAENVPCENRAHSICFEVVDSGIGIPKDKMSHIFEPYSRFYELGKGKEKDGVGMGLHIVETLLKEMGGEISVKSEVGKGSNFSFRLNMREHFTHETQEKDVFLDVSEEEESLVGMNILVAEDDEDNVELLRMALRDAGCDIEFADDGIGVLEEMKKKKYDLILMDLRMPKMDGFEATKVIRREIDKTIPILALTAHVMDWVEDKCKEIGMNGHISKPVDIDKLKRAIRKLSL